MLLRNLHEVFGEIDSPRRRAAVEEIFHENAVFHEPSGASSGCDEIHRIAGEIKATHPDSGRLSIARCRPAGGSFE